MPAAYLILSLKADLARPTSFDFVDARIYSDPFPTSIGDGAQYVEVMRATGASFGDAQETLLEYVRVQMRYAGDFWKVVGNRILADDVKRKALVEDSRKNPRGVAAREPDWHAMQTFENPPRPSLEAAARQNPARARATPKGTKSR